MAMVPCSPLRKTSAVNDAPYRTPVSISCPLIREAAVPDQGNRTSRSGAARLAATAAGTPYPIAPLVGPSGSAGRCTSSSGGAKIAKFPGVVGDDLLGGKSRAAS